MLLAQQSKINLHEALPYTGIILTKKYYVIKKLNHGSVFTYFHYNYGWLSQQAR